MLPKEIGKLTQLEVLKVRHNHLKELPIELTGITTLKAIDIAFNEGVIYPEQLSKYIH
jgi:Leucine-rich repeat (LRR) protein